jgi:hypothetical protein
MRQKRKGTRSHHHRDESLNYIDNLGSNRERRPSTTES